MTEQFPENIERLIAGKEYSVDSIGRSDGAVYIFWFLLPGQQAWKGRSCAFHFPYHIQLASFPPYCKNCVIATFDISNSYNAEFKARSMNRFIVCKLPVRQHLSQIFTFTTTFLTGAGVPAAQRGLCASSGATTMRSPSLSNTCPNSSGSS